MNPEYKIIERVNYAEEDYTIYQSNRCNSEILIQNNETRYSFTVHLLQDEIYIRPSDNTRGESVGVGDWHNAIRVHFKVKSQELQRAREYEANELKRAEEAIQKEQRADEAQKDFYQKHPAIKKVVEELKRFSGYAFININEDIRDLIRAHKGSYSTRKVGKAQFVCRFENGVLTHSDCVYLHISSYKRGELIDVREAGAPTSPQKGCLVIYGAETIETVTDSVSVTADFGGVRLQTHELIHLYRQVEIKYK